jgi:hypothetical protein
MASSPTDQWRGHAIKECGGIWRYVDTGIRVSEQPARPCGHCGEPNTPEGHDPCLGTLPGVINACCGHGCEGDAYVQFADGSTLRGADAARYFAEAEEADDGE